MCLHAYVCVCVCLDVNQGGTNHNHHYILTYNLARTDLSPIMNYDDKPVVKDDGTTR